MRKQTSSSEFVVGLATRDQGYEYKKALYQKIMPDVLILGSSRVLEFRKEFFSQKIVNAGRAMNSLKEGDQFLKEVFHEHKPKLIILGLDFWWFNEKTSPLTHSSKAVSKENVHVSLQDFLLPYKWIWEKKLSFKEYVARVNPLLTFRETCLHGAGVDGNLKKSGFASDGSYFYTKMITGKDRNKDEKFDYILGLIARDHNSWFENNLEVSEKHFSFFMEILSYIKSSGVEVIVFIPPVAPRIAMEMEDTKLVKSLQHALNANGIQYFDFHNPKRSLMTSDCEFIDGIHAGDLLYAKMLHYISLRNDRVRPFIEAQYLSQVCDTYQNLAMIPRPEFQSSPEVDFLHLGCDKSSQFSTLQLATHNH